MNCCLPALNSQQPSRGERGRGGRAAARGKVGGRPISFNSNIIIEMYKDCKKCRGILFVCQYQALNAAPSKYR